MSKTGKLAPAPMAPAKALGYVAATAADTASHAPQAVPRNAGGNLARAIDCARGYGNGGTARGPRGNGGY